MTKCLSFPVRSWVDPPHICLFGNPQSGYILPESLDSDFQSPDQESRVPPLFSPTHVFSIQRRPRIHGRPRGLHRFPSTRPPFYNLLNQIVLAHHKSSNSHTELESIQSAFVDFRVGASATSLTSGHKKLSACRGTLTWEGVDICSRAQGRNLPIQPSA